MSMTEAEETKELVEFYQLLENAFPATSMNVGFEESHESYLNELRTMLFNGLDWRLTDFPDNENDSIDAAFNLLDGTSKLYYIAAYMRESIIDSYYQTGCLNQLKSFARVPGGLFERMDPYQRESVVWYCDMVEAQVNELPFMSRIEFAVNILAVKSIRNTIRNTVW